MKRLITILSILFLMTSTVYAKDAITKGKQTTSAVQYAGSAVITFVKLVEVAADATLTIYDSATAATTGKVVDYLEAEDGDSQVGGPLTVPVTVTNGIYVVLTGANAYYFIHVEPR